ncbi:hypothetical protein FRB99_002990 [Tulasnella sp. 403]|nr:hypothetical protein FRB99_002990 [Tulasnella sp. 403]
MTYELPKAPPEWDKLPIDDALKELKQHLQTAVLIELYTIPLYLYAAYSIRDNLPATRKIIKITKQEMLHLGLSGNILCATGGTPRLFGDMYTPIYPQREYFLVWWITQHSMQPYPQVERPEPRPEVLVRDNILQDYNSIGTFYQEVRKGVAVLSRRIEEAGGNLFIPSTFCRQFGPQDGKLTKEPYVVVTNATTADAAMELIIEQGEGTGSSGREIPGGMQSHHEVFTELYSLSQEGEVPYHDIVENIDASNYAEEKFHGLMIACDAAYSYLLMTIEIMWQYDGDQRRNLVANNITNLMLYVLRPMAEFLVTQRINPDDDKSQYAGPPFRPYQPWIEKADPKWRGALEDLKQLARAGLAKYSPLPEGLKGVQGAVDDLIDLGTLSL